MRFPRQFNRAISDGYVDDRGRARQMVGDFKSGVSATYHENRLVLVGSWIDVVIFVSRGLSDTLDVLRNVGGRGAGPHDEPLGVILCTGRVRHLEAAIGLLVYPGDA